MFDEREAFIAAVAANPDDDTARLAFADWLQERGAEDRAEFIRLQCEARRSDLPITWSRRDAHPTRLAWDARAGELFDAGWRAWFAPFFAALGLGHAWPDRYKHFWGTERASEQAVLGTRSEDDEAAGRVPVGRVFVARGMGSWLLADAIDMPPGSLAEGLRHEPLTDICSG